MIPVEDIEQGQCFRKRTGEFAYLRISDSAARHFGLKHQTHVYGVCYNGNMTEIERGTLVVPVEISVMNENREKEKNWDRIFCRSGVTVATPA